LALATLSVDFVARLAEFRRGLDEAGRLADARSRQIASSFAQLKTLGAGIATAFTAAFAAGGAVVAFAQRINAPLLAMKDLSEATGATIENVSALENVARTAGTSLDVAGGALIRLNQQLSQASGNDRTSESLRRIGLDAQELKRLDPAVALRSVAQALAQYADDGEKARLVQELFGKSVKEAGPFLRELADQQQFAATVTREQVLEADKLNKEIAALKRNAEDAARAVASVLVPALNRIAEAVRERGVTAGLVSLNEQIARLLGLDVGSLVEGRIRTIRQEVELLQGRLTDPRISSQLRAQLETTLQARRNELELLQGQIDSARARAASTPGPDLPTLAPTPAAPPPAPRPVAIPSIGGGGPELDRLRQSVLDLTSQTTSARLETLRNQLAEAVSLRVQTGDVRYDEVLRLIRDQITALDPEAQAAAARMARLNELIEQTPTARLREASADAALLFEELSNATEPQRVRELNEALEALWVRLGQLPEAAERVGEAMSTFAEQAGRNIQNALGDTLERVLSGSFSNIGDLWLQTLRRMAAQAAAARLNEFLFSALGASGNPALVGLSRLFAPRAQGGPVEAGQSYLVGEQGPELITMGRMNGYVTRAERLRTARGGGGGGGGYSPTINVMGDVGPATVSLVERMIGRERARWQRQQYAGGMS